MAVSSFAPFSFFMLASSTLPAARSKAPSVKRCFCDRRTRSARGGCCGSKAPKRCFCDRLQNSVDRGVNSQRREYPAVKTRSLDRSIARQPRRAHLGMAPYLNKEAVCSKTLAERVVREVHLDNFHAERKPRRALCEPPLTPVVSVCLRSNDAEQQHLRRARMWTRTWRRIASSSAATDCVRRRRRSKAQTHAPGEVPRSRGGGCRGGGCRASELPRMSIIIEASQSHRRPNSLFWRCR